MKIPFNSEKISLFLIVSSVAVSITIIVNPDMLKGVIVGLIICGLVLSKMKL